MRRFALKLLILPLAAGLPGCSTYLPPQRQSQIGIGEASGATSIIAGHVRVLDGRTLWFPHHAMRVRLADIDTCELAQWSFARKPNRSRPMLRPVPCGALAKAWLKRNVGNSRVTCKLSSMVRRTATVTGVCTVRGRDLAPELLRVGWARTKGPDPSRKYLEWQRRAASADYGIWGTHMLDMNKWRAKAIDKTLSRQPIADFKLLIEDQKEISAPSNDARKWLPRTNR